MDNDTKLITTAAIGASVALAVELVPIILKQLRKKQFITKLKKFNTERERIIHILELGHKGELQDGETEIALPTILQVAKEHRNFDLRRSAIFALGFIGKNEVIRTLIEIRTDYRISIALRNIADISLARLKATGQVDMVEQQVIDKIDAHWTSEIQKYYLQKEEGFLKRHTTIVVAIIGLIGTITGTLLGIFLG